MRVGGGRLVDGGKTAVGGMKALRDERRSGGKSGGRRD